MAQADLTVFKDEAAQDDVRPPIEVNTSDADEWISLEPIALRKGRRLDVDGVLARSLPKALGDTLPKLPGE